MLEYAQSGQNFIRGMSYEAFAADRKTVFAAARAVEVIGEAANKVDRAFQAAHPILPWSEIISMRHKLIHGYRLVLDSVLYKTVTDDFPALIAELERILKESSHND